MSNSLSRAPYCLRYKNAFQAFLMLGVLICSSLAIANINRNELTAAYLFRLAENVQWPNAASISKYRIHLIDRDRRTFQALKSIARNNTLNGKPFSVTQSRSTSVPKGVHLVFVAESRASSFKLVLNQVEGKNILLVSDQVENKRQIMINLFDTASKQLQFEINKANILNQNLGVNPDIILLGGTEIDVAKLYREGQKQLQTLELQVRELDVKRRLLQENAAKFEREAALLARELEKQKKAVQREQERLKKAEEQTNIQRIEIDRHEEELRRQKGELERQEILIAEQHRAVERERALLKAAETQYQHQQEKLNAQEMVIIGQRQSIANEQMRLKEAEDQTDKLRAFIKNQEQQVEQKLQKYEQLTAKVKQQEEALSSQVKQIEERAATIREQDTTINTQTELLARQTTIIRSQKDYLKAMGLAVLLGTLLALVTLFSYRSKKNANNLLTQQNLILEKTSEELTIAKKAAEKANQAKTVFLTTMSHELRTPLNAILGFSQLMRRDPSLPESQKEKLTIINSSGEHLLDLINDVLEVSKIEAGRITLNTSTFNLYSMLDGIEGIFQGRIEDKDVSLEFKKDAALPQFITADQGKVRQVLINLLGNAIKFTSEGVISLKASLVSTLTPGAENTDSIKNRESIANTPVQMLLQFEVKDTGIGIAKEDYSKIFAPFEQAKDGAKKEGSTGLGLSISKRYAQLMGGNVTFSSQLGQGSAFCFEIKALAGRKEDEEAAQLLPMVHSLAPDQPQKRILVVDDNATNRLLLEKILTNVGFEVREAENGKQAIDMFQEWHPHLLLLDIKMPVMDGTEATKRIRAIPEGKDVVIIIVSASVFEDQRRPLLELGANAFLRKPIREELLFTEIQRHLGVRYLYQEQEVEPTVRKLERQDITKLPESLQEAFRQAVLLGDITQLNELANKASECNSEVGAALLAMVERFELNTIQELFGKETNNGD